MGKILRPQDKILLGLAVLGDIFEEMRDPLGMVGGAYKSVYGFVPKNYRRNNFEKSLNRTLKTGYVEKIIKGNEPYLRLTSQGKKKLVRDFPLFAFQGKRWDGKWRVAVFDIPEKQKKTRDYLRNKLAELGFGMLQESVWVTPFDVVQDLREFLEFRHLEDNVFVLVAKRLFAGNEKILAQKIWPLQKINQRYQEILIGYEKNKENVGKKENLAKDLKGKYLEILTLDPCLPRELLPDDWLGEEARRLIKSLT